ncbi:hypothetical protein FHS10_004551 [Mucilaginibacter dorajii]|nr:hypothetical protein [Mucilaginibacter dorajii]
MLQQKIVHLQEGQLYWSDTNIKKATNVTLVAFCLNKW